MKSRNKTVLFIEVLKFWCRFEVVPTWGSSGLPAAVLFMCILANILFMAWQISASRWLLIGWSTSTGRCTAEYVKVKQCKSNRSEGPQASQMSWCVTKTFMAVIELPGIFLEHFFEDWTKMKGHSNSVRGQLCSPMCMWLCTLITL